MSRRLEKINLLVFCRTRTSCQRCCVWWKNWTIQVWRWSRWPWGAASTSWKNDVSDTVPRASRGRCYQVTCNNSSSSAVAFRYRAPNTRIRSTRHSPTANAQPAPTTTISMSASSLRRPVVARTAHAVYSVQASGAPRPARPFPVSSRADYGMPPLPTRRIERATRYAGWPAVTAYL